MTISRKYSVAASIVFIVIISTACGMKADPIAPEKILIPKVEDLHGVLANDEVVLSWTPSLNYSNNKPIELSAVEIYRLDQDVTEILSELREREEEQEKARIEAGLSSDDNIKKAAGELATTINLLAVAPTKGFEDEARVVARIPVEQLLDRAEGTKIYWKQKLSVARENKIDSRLVYAIREVDSYGKRSNVSNFVFVYPFETPPAPKEFNINFDQKSLNILWAAPERNESDLFLALKGFNLYRSDTNGVFCFSPLNKEPLKYTAPVDWKAVELKSYQRVKGSKSNYALLITTSDKQGASGIAQSIYAAGEVNQHIGQEVDVTVAIRSIGESSPGRIILDASRDPKLTYIDKENAVFRYEQDPLVEIKEINITDTLTEFTMSGKVPVGAKGYQIIIEPRSWNSVSGSYVIESVRVEPKGRQENLLKNGDFSAAPALKYKEEIKDFGGTYQYKMTALYEVAGFEMESEASDVKEIVLKDTFPPEAPQNVKAQATFDSVSLTWDHSKSTDVEGYIVMRRARDERKFTKLTPKPIKNTVFRDKEVKPGTIYFYQVRAVDKAGNTSKDAVAESVEVLKRN